MFQNYSMRFIELVQLFPTRKVFLSRNISINLGKEFPHFIVYMISILFAFSTSFVFQNYSINFLNLVVLQCDAMSVFSHEC